jgi:hypothetical protein
MSIRKEDIDANGMVTAGPYAGYALTEVMEYLESKAGPATPPKKDEPATPPASDTPESELDKRATARMQPLVDAQAALNNRLEQEDEEQFSSTVKDYDKKFMATDKTIRQIITEHKKTLHPAMRVTKGIHRQLYLLVKQQDPTHASKLLQTEEEEVVTEEETTEELPPAEIPVTPPKKTPKAAPPAVAPPPPVRKQPAAVPGSKLKGNSKTEAAAKAFGLEHDEYLKRLEQNGTTQDTLDAMSINRKAAQAAGRKTVYDRV